jgi:DNA-binding transcriptional ArsR family regulator
MSEVLSIYTPSNLKPEILEKIFVQRKKLLEKSVQWIEESIVSKKKNHLLFIGSRGAGKTHLISMIINRLKVKDTVTDKMVLVWLGEDDVVTNFLDFVLSILRGIANENEFNLDCLKLAKGKGHNEAIDIILDGIMNQLGDRTLLVVKENMSDVFHGLKDDGQKKLRALLQEKKNMVLLTSSQQLFEGVSSRDAAFFGFFDIHHLEPLSVDDAMKLIAKVSKLKGDEELYNFIHTSQGRYRVRALHHLAGGNQRLYMNLLEFLTAESLNNLVSALSKLADDLTPYFQERIKSLPPQQGRIVQKLCDIEGALPVKSIAEELFIGERSVAKQLGELKNKNYVISHKRGKQTYYEIAEPLMRLSLEVKHNHGKPLKILVLLLRAWFSDKELKINLFENTDTLLFNYIEEALSIDTKIVSDLCTNITKELVSCFQTNNYQGAINYASELLSSPDKKAYDEYKILLLRATAYVAKDEMKFALNDVINALNLNELTIDAKLAFMYLASCIYYSLYKIEEAHSSLDSMFKLRKKCKTNEIFFVSDILNSIIQNPSIKWKKEIRFLVSIFHKYKAMEYLNESLIETIDTFINNKNLLPLFDAWQEIWQEEASDYEFMQTPLQVLKVVREALEVKNDKPLFALPREIRELVLPMIEDAIK